MGLDFRPELFRVIITSKSILPVLSPESTKEQASIGLQNLFKEKICHRIYAYLYIVLSVFGSLGIYCLIQVDYIYYQAPSLAILTTIWRITKPSHFVPYCCWWLCQVRGLHFVRNSVNVSGLA